uniref:RNA-dependent RNA polymerase n=1 Tax=Amalga-like chassivirus TaxID=2784736 RepID=A0A7S6YL56_9VIRU|nr:RNA-dependent RNA polymerase [Amalga-like chassivirus]
MNSNWNSIPSELRDEYINQLINYRVVISGSFTTNQQSFIDMSNGNDNSNKIKAEEYLEYVLLTDLYGLKLAVVDKDITPDLLKHVYLNSDSFPGIMTENYFGRERKQTIQFTLPIAEQLLEVIKNKSVKYCGLWKILGREKDVKLTPEGVLKGTRPVLAPEELLNLIGGLIGQLVTLGLRSIDDNLFFIGKSFERKAFESFYENNKWFDVMCSEDFIGFDKFVDRELILSACAIIRSLLPEDKQYDRIMYFLATSLIHKHVVAPPGVIYEISNGLPSGHPLTSLVGTLINYIVWNRILCKVYGGSHDINTGKPNWKSRFCGDDAQHLLKYISNLANKIERAFKDDCPLSIEPLQQNFYPISSRCPEFNAKFLKRCVNSDGMVYWERASIMKKLLYPPIEKKDYFEMREWVNHWIEAAPGDLAMNDLLRGYLMFIGIKPLGEVFKKEPVKLRQSLALNILEEVTLRGLLRVGTERWESTLVVSKPRKNVQACYLPLVKTMIPTRDIQTLALTSIMDSRQYLKYIQDPVTRELLSGIIPSIQRSRPPPRLRKPH